MIANKIKGKIFFLIFYICNASRNSLNYYIFSLNFQIFLLCFYLMEILFHEFLKIHEFVLVRYTTISEVNLLIYEYFTGCGMNKYRPHVQILEMKSGRLEAMFDVQVLLQNAEM